MKTFQIFFYSCQFQATLVQFSFILSTSQAHSHFDLFTKIFYKRRLLIYFNDTFIFNRKIHIFHKHRYFRLTNSPKTRTNKTVKFPYKRTIHHNTDRKFRNDNNTLINQTPHYNNAYLQLNKSHDPIRTTHTHTHNSPGDCISSGVDRRRFAPKTISRLAEGGFPGGLGRIPRPVAPGLFMLRSVKTCAVLRRGRRPGPRGSS